MPYALIENGVVAQLWLPGNPPDGYVECGDEVQPGYTFDGEHFSPPATPGPAVGDYENAVQSHVDSCARSKLFRDGVTLASYTASTNAQWAAEAQAFVAWRDAVWAYAYQELARVQGGERVQPSVAEIIAELPTVSWP